MQSRGRAVPVRLHRQAAQGQLRREDDRRRGRRDAPGDVLRRRRRAARAAPAIDPRVKLVTLFGLLVAAALVRHIPVLVALYAATLVLAVTSGLPLGFFVKRVWLFIPIFTGIVVLPATLNFVTHGQIVVPLGTWFGHPVGLTRQGLDAAGLIVTRVAVSISLVVLLTLTTPWNRLLGVAAGAVRAAHVRPRARAWPTATCSTCSNGVTDMYTARKARTVTRDADVASGRAFVAATGGALFGKAHALSEEVHLAMVSRGYTGTPSHDRATPRCARSTACGRSRASLVLDRDARR